MSKVKKTVSIVDYGMGNLASIKNMLKHIGAVSEIVSSPTDLDKAEAIVLPGVGAFENGMNHLRDSGLIDVLNQKVLVEKTPILGICLGMQLMTRSSEEGQSSGLGWFAADTRRFDFKDNPERLKTPHMGWNLVCPQKEHFLCNELPPEPRFYFVHSYHVVCDDADDILMTSIHGYQFTSAIARGHIYGAQFHPEKSHKFGMAFFRNFVDSV